jgi:hypothetical protein
MSDEKKEKKPIIVNSRSDDYRSVFVHQFYGGFREDHFEMIVESLSTNAAESQAKKEVILELKDEICLKMSPEQVKRLYVFLGNQISLFEKDNRKIEAVMKPAKESNKKNE